ncbi:hypothetical protein GW571_04525 [Clavibacter capsici]|uniref:hypothetical protein n=1 Tax=Clavibacter capsici TaxID=1874630 RepID=UPI00142849EB|nr:hypothetical protein [Clavibacter capsici]QIS41459.1 hypothetical protein GW571_04525 [Clavibacter capsici]
MQNFSAGDKGAIAYEISCLEKAGFSMETGRRSAVIHTFAGSALALAAVVGLLHSSVHVARISSDVGILALEVFGGPAALIAADVLVLVGWSLMAMLIGRGSGERNARLAAVGLVLFGAYGVVSDMVSMAWPLAGEGGLARGGLQTGAQVVAGVVLVLAIWVVGREGIESGLVLASLRGFAGVTAVGALATAAALYVIPAVLTILQYTALLEQIASGALGLILGCSGALAWRRLDEGNSVDA